MRLSTCGSVVMFQPPDLPDPGTPADPGSLLPWEHAASTLRKAHRIADRSYFGHGPEDKAGGPAGAGMGTEREPKQHSQSRLGTRRLRARMPARPVAVRQHGEDAGR